MFNLRAVVLLVLFFYNVQTEVNIRLTKNPSIIIVGAGASGMAAASKLLKNNITNLKILEVENRIGGRVKSVKFGDAFIEVGAEFCHGEKNNVVYELANEYNILKGSNGTIAKLYRSNGEEISQDLINRMRNFTLYIFFEEGKRAECENAKSLGDCLDICFEQLLSETTEKDEKALVENFKEHIESFICSYSSSFDLHELSYKTSFEDSEGDPDLHWNGKGYKIIFDILMQKYPPTATPLPIDDKIFLNKEVVKVSGWDQEDLVEVTCKDGSVYKADQVLFSPSLGVLKADHKTLFDPALPEKKVEAIENIAFGAILKIFLMFPEPTHLTHEIIPIFEKNEFEGKNKHLEWLKSLVEIVPTENNPKVMHGWYAGKHVPEIEKLTDEEIAEGQKYVIEKFVRPVLNVTEPVKILRTIWIMNPHFRGTYSYEHSKAAKPGKEYFDELAEPLRNGHNKPTVSLIGEATNSKHYGTVHGAIETGFREAQRIIDNYITYNN